MKIKKEKINNTEDDDIINSFLNQSNKNSWKIDFGKIALGLFLIIFGILYLAKNLGWLPLEIGFNMFDLWPLLLIFWGLSLISSRGWMAILAGSILTITTLIIVAVLTSPQMTISLDPELTQMPEPRNQVGPNNFIKSYPLNFEADIKLKELFLNINNQLGNIKLSGNANKLVSGSLKSNFSELVINSQLNTNSRVIELNSLSKYSKVTQSQSLLDLQLTNNTPVIIELNNGSSETSALLQNIWLTDLIINSQGSSLELDLGQKAKQQTIKLQGRYRSINLRLPKDAGIIITGITNEIAGFKHSGKTLRTANFNQATKFISITFDTEPDELKILWSD